MIAVRHSYLVLVIMVLLAGDVSADTTQWLGVNGDGGDGTFHNSNNWDAGIPNAGDTAEFSAGEPGIVTFTQNAFSSRVDILDGMMTFAFDASTDLLYAISDSLEVRGATSSLTLDSSASVFDRDVFAESGINVSLGGVLRVNDGKLGSFDEINVESGGSITASGASALVSLDSTDGANGSSGANGGNGSGVGFLNLSGTSLVDIQSSATLRLEGGKGGNGGDDNNSPGRGGDGGKAGFLIVDGGMMTLAGATNARGGEGGMGGGGEIDGGGGDGGNGGTTRITGGELLVTLTGSLDARGGRGGHSGFNLGGTGNSGGTGGEGGQLNILGGLVTSLGTINLRGGDGGARSGDGGSGGNVSITGGELELVRGTLDLRGGAGDSFNGSDGAGGSLDLSGGQLAVNALGSNSIEAILLGGQFNFNSGTLRITDAGGFTVGSSGFISTLLGGSAINLPFNKSLIVDRTLSMPSGTSLTLNGGSVTAESIVIDTFAKVMNEDANGSLNGAVLALPGSEIFVNSGVLTIGDENSVNGFYSNGMILMGRHGIVLRDANDAVFDSASLVTFGASGAQGTLSADNGVTLDFGGNFIGHGTVDTPNNAATPVINNGNITGNSLAEPITLTGYVKGVGTCDNCNITGTDSPGFSPATVNRGSVSYNGTLEIEIGGTTVGEFDQLNHLLGAGIADLGGTLDVDLIDGFSPLLGDSFEFITAVDVQGVFDTELLPALPGGLQWFVDYGANSVSLLVELAGDFDLDGDVDGSDFLTWQRGVSPNPLSSTDLASWQTNFGSSVSPTAASRAVPEPSAWIGIVIACLMSIANRSRNARKIE